MNKTTYVLSKRIARGGMAEIYLGKAVGNDEFQRICAIKRILPHYAQDSEFIEMFRDEAHICKRLQHANVVQVYDFTAVEGSYALIMEHVNGADLRSLLSACETAKIRLSVPISVYIAACAARGLHYAHTKVDEMTNDPLGIIHRDISPQNILLSYEGEVKITDFGIASADNKITDTRPGVVKGKYSYMSPEQVAAKPLDGRSDIFSLAIVLWECLAMKRLFTGKTEVETIRKVQQCEIPFKLTDINPDVKADLAGIVEKGLSKDLKRRYQTAASLEKDLLKYLHSNYPDFTSGELGNFLKQIFAKKRGKSLEDIRHTLATSANQPASTGAPPGEMSQQNNQPTGSRQQEATGSKVAKEIAEMGDYTKLKNIPLDQSKLGGFNSRYSGPRNAKILKPNYKPMDYRQDRRGQKGIHPGYLLLLCAVMVFTVYALFFRSKPVPRPTRQTNGMDIPVHIISEDRPLYVNIDGSGGALTPIKTRLRANRAHMIQFQVDGRSITCKLDVSDKVQLYRVTIRRKGNSHRCGVRLVRRKT